ncbi:MAG TPA: hypothetical protein ENG60_01005 [Thermoplasmatales archaeon]|nr:hypothetical protein [Thermoplasmatales archaeon]HEX16981.1 hypothetical protein [Thermoplasmatales archaeon]
MEDEISSYVDEILSAVGDDLDLSREEIEKEFRKFLEYGVPPDLAKRSLVKKFGGDRSGRKLLKDVRPNERNLNLICKVITKNVKQISVRGESRIIHYGLLADESAILPFTSWRSSFPAEKGDVVERRNAYSREWHGNVQINMGERTSIKKLEEDVLPDLHQEPRKCKIMDIYKTFGPLELKVKIMDIAEKDIEIGGEKRRIYSGILADDTGKAQFTAWHDFNLKKDDVINIRGCYARFWKGIPQVILDERTEVKKLSEKMETTSPVLPLHKLVELRGGLDITAEGTVIEIKEGSGYIERCPECRRLMRNGECRIHGKIKGIADLRLRLVLDDGFAGIGVILNRELTEKLIGKSLEECKRIVETEGREKLLEDISSSLLTRRIRVRGNAFGDEFGTTLIARSAEILNENLREEAEKLLQMLEGER